LSSERPRPLKVALACPGVGLEQRGFERMFYDIFQLLADDNDITIYKGGGVENEQEVVLRFANRNGWFAKYVPLHKLFGRSPIHLECLTFCIALLTAIRKHDYDVVHVIDPPLAKLLFKLRNRFKLKFRILYTEGCKMPPDRYPPADHLQQVSQAAYQDAVEYGCPEDFMTLLPVGFYPERFEVTASRSELRRKYGVGDSTFVVLSIAAINRNHKRIDHLAREFARLDGDTLLWLDGSMDQGDPELVSSLRRDLGDGCRITHVPTADVGELLKSADLFVHSALSESFGLSIVEAASTGLPILIHDSAHFQWLVPNPACWVDMSRDRALTDRLRELIGDRAGLPALVTRDETRQRFSWHSLRSDYLALYASVARLPSVA